MTARWVASTSDSATVQTPPSASHARSRSRAKGPASDAQVHGRVSTQTRRAAVVVAASADALRGISRATAPRSQNASGRGGLKDGILVLFVPSRHAIDRKIVNG